MVQILLAVAAAGAVTVILARITCSQATIATFYINLYEDTT